MLLESTVESNGKRYYVSTVKLKPPHKQWETLVFEYGPNGFLIGNEVFGLRWNTSDDAKDGHLYLVKRFGTDAK